jgi:hypothetical protein
LYDHLDAAVFPAFNLSFNQLRIFQVQDGHLDSER